MGVLRLIGIPFRRLLHSDSFAAALTNLTAKGDTSTEILGVLMSHAPAAIVLLGAHIVYLTIFMLITIAAIALVIIPIRAVRNWQKIKVANGEQGRKRYMLALLVILGIILLLAADATWGNIATYSIAGAAGRAASLVTSIDRHLVVMEKSASDAQRFVTGMFGIFAKAATGGEDIRPMLKDVDELLGEGRIFSEYARVQTRALEHLVVNAGLKDHPVLKGTLENITNALRAKEVMARLRPLAGHLKALAGVDSNSRGGMAAFKLSLNSLERVRLAITEVDPIIQKFELGRFLGVFLMIGLLILTAAAGIQFYRMRRFRIIGIVMCVTCFTLCGLEILSMSHLVLGTVFGALCDGVYGRGGQRPIVLYNQPGLPVITGPHLHNFTASCKAGADIPGALMATFVDDSVEKNRLVNISDIITLDPLHHEVTINTGPVAMTIPLEGHRGDLKKAAESVVDQAIKDAGPKIIERAREITTNMDQVKDAVASFDIGELLTKVDNLKTIISSFDTSAELPLELANLIKEIKVEATQRLDRIATLLKRIQSKQGQIKQMVENIGSYLVKATSSPENFIQELQQELRLALHPFVANVLQPAFECQEVGTEVQTLLDTLCVPGSAIQGLYVAMALLVNAAVVVVLLQLFSRNFGEERTATNVNPT